MPVATKFCTVGLKGHQKHPCCPECGHKHVGTTHTTIVCLVCGTISLKEKTPCAPKA
jgi:NADH pyrophosphatase NudC (nudix superfamily)